jgi:membrane-associated phospholipid phosphatase
LCIERGQTELPIHPIGAYIATGIGAMRVLNNRHWASDVLAGAGIGILATQMAYLTHQYKWTKKKQNAVISPAYSNGPQDYTYAINCKFLLTDHIREN